MFMGEIMGNVSGRAGGARAIAHAARPSRRSLAAAVVFLAMLLLHGAPAQAFSQRGHEFAGSFGESGEPLNHSKPTSIAVNETSGDVYVLESANNRVVVYGPGHEFLETWGFGVSNGEKALQRCKEQAKCLPGLAGFNKEGQLDAPPAIAVDNSAGVSKGDVYVVANRTWKKASIFKFTPSGELLGNLVTKAEREEEIEQPIWGVAVDQSGTVWVDREDEEEEFSLERYDNGTLSGRTLEEPEEFEVDESEVPLSEFVNTAELGPEEVGLLGTAFGELEIESVRRPVRPGFAIDSAGDFYLTFEPFGWDFEELEELKEEHEHPETLEHPCLAHNCFAEKFALTGTSPKLNAETLVPKLDRANTTGLAVDVSSGEASNDVFIDNASSIAAFTPSGSLIQRFATKELEDGGGSGLAVDSATHEVLVGDTVAGRIDTYKLEKPAAPKIEAGSPIFTHDRATSAELRATIDPTGGSELHYLFAYGTGNCTSSPGSCTEVAPELKPGEQLQEGFGEQTVAVHLGGLSPSTVYHFLVIAESNLGKVTSEEGTLTTQPSAVEASMLDGRAWELVSPADKHGASVLGLEKEGGLIQAAADGRSLAYVADAPVGGNEFLGYRGPEPTEILANRSGTQWSSEDIATENGIPAQGLDLGGPWEYEYFSPELSSAFVDPYSAVPPSTETEAPERTVYLRQDETCAATPSTCYVPLVSAADDTAKTSFAEAKLKFEGASPDLRHVVLSSVVGLTSTAAPSGEALYEWFAERPPSEQLQLISLLPGGEQAPAQSLEVGAKEGGEARAGGVSENGLRVVWTDLTPEVTTLEEHIYMRQLNPEDGGREGETLLVDEPDTSAPRKLGKLIGKQQPNFQSASPDDSKVFFTDPQRLTSNATGGTLRKRTRPVRVRTGKARRRTRHRPLAGALQRRRRRRAGRRARHR